MKHDASLAARPPGPGPNPQAGLPAQAGAAATRPPAMPYYGDTPGPGYPGGPAAPGADPATAALAGGVGVGYPEVHLAGGPGAGGYGPGFAAADQPPPPPPGAQGHLWLQLLRRRT